MVISTPTRAQQLISQRQKTTDIAKERSGGQPFRVSERQQVNIAEIGETPRFVDVPRRVTQRGTTALTQPSGFKTLRFDTRTSTFKKVSPVSQRLPTTGGESAAQQLTRLSARGEALRAKKIPSQQVLQNNRIIEGSTSDSIVVRGKVVDRVKRSVTVGQGINVDITQTEGQIRSKFRREGREGTAAEIQLNRALTAKRDRESRLSKGRSEIKTSKASARVQFRQAPPRTPDVVTDLTLAPSGVRRPGRFTSLLPGLTGAQARAERFGGAFVAERALERTTTAGAQEDFRKALQERTTVERSQLDQVDPATGLQFRRIIQTGPLGVTELTLAPDISTLRQVGGESIVEFKIKSQIETPAPIAVQEKFFEDVLSETSKGLSIREQRALERGLQRESGSALGRALATAGTFGAVLPEAVFGERIGGARREVIQRGLTSQDPALRFGTALGEFATDPLTLAALGSAQIGGRVVTGIARKATPKAAVKAAGRKGITGSVVRTIPKGTAIGTGVLFGGAEIGRIAQADDKAIASAEAIRNLAIGAAFISGTGATKTPLRLATQKFKAKLPTVREEVVTGLGGEIISKQVSKVIQAPPLIRGSGRILESQIVTKETPIARIPFRGKTLEFQAGLSKTTESQAISGVLPSPIRQLEIIPETTPSGKPGRLATLRVGFEDKDIPSITFRGRKAQIEKLIGSSESLRSQGVQDLFLGGTKVVSRPKGLRTGSTAALGEGINIGFIREGRVSFTEAQVGVDVSQGLFDPTISLRQFVPRTQVVETPGSIGLLRSQLVREGRPGRRTQFDTLFGGFDARDGNELVSTGLFTTLRGRRPRKISGTFESRTLGIPTEELPATTDLAGTTIGKTIKFRPRDLFRSKRRDDVIFEGPPRTRADVLKDVTSFRQLKQPRTRVNVRDFPEGSLGPPSGRQLEGLAALTAEEQLGRQITGPLGLVQRPSGIKGVRGVRGLRSSQLRFAGSQSKLLRDITIPGRGRLGRRTREIGLGGASRVGVRGLTALGVSERGVLLERSGVRPAQAFDTGTLSRTAQTTFQAEITGQTQLQRQRLFFGTPSTQTTVTPSSVFRPGGVGLPLVFGFPRPQLGRGRAGRGGFGGGRRQFAGSVTGLLRGTVAKPRKGAVFTGAEVRGVSPEALRLAGILPERSSTKSKKRRRRKR